MLQLTFACMNNKHVSWKKYKCQYIVCIFCRTRNSHAPCVLDLLLVAEIISCDSNADMLCLNGGRCVQQLNNYTCECQADYGGSNCELGKQKWNWKSFICGCDCSVACGCALVEFLCVFAQIAITNSVYFVLTVSTSVTAEDEGSTKQGNYHSYREGLFARAHQ